jgi:hypothetical protein
LVWITFQINWKTLDGKKTAAYKVKYTDGTPCEIIPDFNREITIYYGKLK